MNSDAKLLLLVILITFAVKEAVSTFELQYLGDYLTDEEYQSLEKCDHKYCILDGDELFYAATQNSSVHPCDDIREFAMGTFWKYRAINER